MIVLNSQTIGQLPWLVDAIRLTTIEANRSGQGVRAIIDPQLAPALEAIHEELDRDWTLTSLAKTARMSRTQFARRF